MSVVTNILLWSSLEDADDRIESWLLRLAPAINAYLDERYHGELVQVDHLAGGTKEMEATVYAGAFNYFDLPAFIDFLQRLSWTKPEYVRLIIQEDEDDVPRLYSLSGLA